MASEKQIAANRRNASKSAAARSPEARARVRFNAIKHSRRAKTLILPGESRQDYDDCLAALIRSCKPRNEAEFRLLERAVRSIWIAERAERVNELRIIELIEQEDERAEIDVHKKMKRLFHDPRGSLALYGFSSAADGGPRTSSHEKPEDDEKYDPFVLVKQLEANPLGCQKLAEMLGELRSRIERGLGFQAPDRLRLLRILGKNPVMAALDEGVAKIYVASFAIYPFGCKNAYEDLRADANDEEYKLLVERIRSRSPLVLDASDTAAARQFLLDLIDRNLERLEAKLEVHRQLAEQYKIRNAARAARDETPEGEMARRHEMTCDRRVKRCMDLFWKLRRETERDESEGGDEVGEVDCVVCAAEEALLMAEGGNEGPGCVPDADENLTNDANAEVGSAGAVCIPEAGENLTNDANAEVGSAGAECVPDADENLTNDANLEVRKAGEECIPGTDENLTNDAKLEIAKSEVASGKRVVEPPNEFENLIGAISACRERRDDRFGTPAAGRRSIEEAIFSRGPLLRPIE